MKSLTISRVALYYYNLGENLIKKECLIEETKPNEEETEIQKTNQQILENFTSKIKGAIFPAKIAISIFNQLQK